MTIRIGEVLVSQGILTEHQVQQVLDTQGESARPFGLIAEELFSIEPEVIENAWVHQYAAIAERADLATLAPTAEALTYIERRQAWQFAVLPLRMESGELVIATTTNTLARALRFITRCLTVPGYLVIAETDALGKALEQHYPMAGLSSSALKDCPAQRITRADAA